MSRVAEERRCGGAAEVKGWDGKTVGWGGRRKRVGCSG